MNNEKVLPSPLPGTLIFAFSYEERKKGSRAYHVFYDKEQDEYNGAPQIVGAMYKLMKEEPGLVEPMLLVTQQVAEELSKPLEEILNSK